MRKVLHLYVNLLRVIASGIRTMKKSELAARLLENNIHLLKCPVCGEEMTLRELKSIVCMNNHCFDISRTGYVNMLNKETKTKYTAGIFLSRRTLSDQGFYNPLLEKLFGIVLERKLGKIMQPLFILDAGCGEGSMVSGLVDKLNLVSDSYIHATGIDIAKEGVQIAAKNYTNCNWFVGDIADMPFGSKCFDVIFNILSPSNYSEFRRVLKDNGVLVKVLPGEKHFDEIRKLIFKDTMKEEYSNKEVRKHLENNFEIQEEQTIRYTVQLNRKTLHHVIRMSPLSWDTDIEDNNVDDIVHLKSVVFDFVILVGERRARNSTYT